MSRYIVVKEHDGDDEIGYERNEIGIFDSYSDAKILFDKSIEEFEQMLDKYNVGYIEKEYAGYSLDETEIIIAVEVNTPVYDCWETFSIERE